MSTDGGRHDAQSRQHLAHLLWVAEDDPAVLTVARSIQQVVADHDGTGAAFGGVFADRLQGFQVSHKLPGFNPGDDADRSAAAKVQPGAIRIEVGIEFFEE